ncbi:hypothetical protein LUZ60_007371 [Juncus effusus]|nr:hypothetical protein LUZ60_007371 [Juncus effusus]
MACYYSTLSPSPSLFLPRFSFIFSSSSRPVKLSTRPLRRSFQKPTVRRKLISPAKSSFPLSPPLIKPDDHWSTWTALFSFAAFGLWSEKTKWGSTLSGALVSILAGLTASSLGLIPSDAPAHQLVFNYLLPIAVPLLLLAADLRRIVRSTGDLLFAFLIGSVGTIIGTLVAFLLVPMKSLGQDSWKIAAALMSSYIGGTVNYVAVSEALNTSPSVVAAGVAADNVICALYFTLLFALSTKMPPESPSSSPPVKHCKRDSNSNSSSNEKLSVTHSAIAIAVSLSICKIGTGVSASLGVQGFSLPFNTFIVVFLATLFPKQLGKIAPSGESIALILMQVFFGVVGASGNIADAITKAPEIFSFAFIQVLVHLLFTLFVGKLFKINKKLLLIGSNANIGGPTTACTMASSKGWNSLILPGVLVGIFGISVSTFLGVGLGLFVLKRLC